MNKKQNVKSNFVKFIFIVILLMLLYSISYFFIIQRPFFNSERNNIFKSFSSNFDFKSESISNYFNLLNDEGILVTSRTKIREKLIQYNFKKIDFKTLKDYTKPKLEDVVSFSQNIVGIVRFPLNTDKFISVGKTFNNNLWIKPQKGNNKIIHGFIFKENNNYYYNSLFPILDPQKGLVGYDLVFYKINYLINSSGEKKNGIKNFYNNIEYQIQFITKINSYYYFFPEYKNVSGKSLCNTLKYIFDYKPNKKIKFIDKNRNILILKIINPFNIILVFKINETDLYKAIFLYYKKSFISFGILIVIISTILYLFSRPFSNSYIITLKELEQKINEKNQQLLKEKKIFETYLDIATLIIVVIDKNGNIEYINDYGLHLVEYSYNEIIGKNWFDTFILDKEKEDVKKVFSKIMSGNLEPFKSYTNKIKTKSGKLLIIEWQNKYFTDNQGNIIATFSTGLDITNRKEKEKQIEFILSSVRAFLWQSEFDKNNNFKPLYYSKGIQNIVGYSFSELFNNTPSWEDIVVNEHKNIILKSRENMLKLISGTEEYQVITKTGKIVWLKNWYNPVKLEDKIIVNGFCIDITHEKELEQWFRTIVNTLSELNIGYLIYTSKGINDSIIIDINKAFEKLTGYKEEEVLNKMNPLEFVSDNFLELARDRLSKRIKGEKVPSHYQIELKRKDGTNFIAELNITMIEINGEKYIFALFMDITDKIKKEQNLMAKQKLEAIGILTSGIAHDFNNILGGIFGWVSLLENAITDQEQLEMVKEIKKAGKRAADLITKLLAFARKGKYENKVINLNKIINTVLDILKPSINKNIKIITNLEKSLYNIEGDPEQLQQVVLNLCVNAVQAMPIGGTLTITTSNFSVDEKFASTHFNILEGEYVLLTVDDTGIGMDEKTKQHIFEPFFTTKKEGQGTGLGLSTVYGIVKNHKGIITVYSEVNKGSSFKIYLPAIFKNENGIKERVEKIKIVKGHGTILIIDDEEMIRDVYSKMLKMLGFNILSANNGYEGIKIFKENKDKINLVILDLNMPEMDGEVTFEKLKLIKNDIKVIIATGFAINGSVQKLLDKGADAYIKKPFSIEEFSKVINNVYKNNQ